MDDFERYMSRQRARRQRALKGHSTDCLWDFENWSNDQSEDHHVARKLYGDTLISVTQSMHRELTRRQLEEHPPDGPDPSTFLERLGRLFLGLGDILDCLGDFLRDLGTKLIEAASIGKQTLAESGYSLAQFASLMAAVIVTLTASLAMIR